MKIDIPYIHSFKIETEEGNFCVIEPKIIPASTSDPIGSKGMVLKTYNITKNMLDKPITNNIESEIVGQMMLMASKNDDDRFDIKDQNINYRKLISLINVCSSKIAMDSMFGPATHIMISSRRINQYNLREMISDSDNLMGMKVIINNSIDDILVFRQSNKDHPNLHLFYDDNNYKFEATGNSDKMFIRIRFASRKKKMKTILR